MHKLTETLMQRICDDIATNNNIDNYQLMYSDKFDKRKPFEKIICTDIGVEEILYNCSKYCVGYIDKDETECIYLELKSYINVVNRKQVYSMIIQIKND